MGGSEWFPSVWGQMPAKGSRHFLNDSEHLNDPKPYTQCASAPFRFFAISTSETCAYKIYTTYNTIRIAWLFCGSLRYRALFLLTSERFIRCTQPRNLARSAGTYWDWVTQMVGCFFHLNIDQLGWVCSPLKRDIKVGRGTNQDILKQGNRCDFQHSENYLCHLSLTSVQLWHVSFTLTLWGY